MNRRGFSLVETLIAITVLGILVNLAIPATQALKGRADGAAVVGDVRAIRSALFDHYAATSGFPPTSGAGQIPSGLAPSLPTGFTFEHKNNSYGWINLESQQPSLQILYVIGTDSKLVRYVADSYAGSSLVFGQTALLFVE